MYNDLTTEEQALFSDQAEKICQHTALLVGLQNDDGNTISGDNGKGFGSGIGSFCYNFVGEDYDNPTMMQKYDQTYSVISSPRNKLNG